MVVRILLGLVVLVLGGVAAHETGWKIDESHVHRHLERQLAIMRDFDLDAVCRDAAADYRMRSLQYSDDRLVLDEVLDAQAACEQARESLRVLQDAHHRSRGLLRFDFQVEVRAVQLAPGGRSARVESVATVKLGQRLVARSRGHETLSRAFWRVRSHGGESRTWMYVD